MASTVESVMEPKTGSQNYHLPLVFTMIAVIAAVMLALALRVDHPKQTRDVVARVASPDVSVVAVVYELSGDAKSSFNYQIEVVADGQVQRVAELSGAMRNDRAFGVNPVWVNKDELSIQYLTAQGQNLVANEVTVGGHHVRVTLQGGVRDDTAPAGGMLFNLQQSREPSGL